jgi:alpha-tubulin suppressor-like RCC1 family protein
MNNDEISYFSYLSNDNIRQIALQLNINDIYYYCLYNARFNDIVCNDNWFWKEKFLIDFGQPEYDTVDDWKTLYKNYGSVYIFGEFGVSESQTPTKIPNFRFKSVSSGAYHTVTIDFNGNMWTFGSNFNGQLGLNNKNFQHTPTKIPLLSFGIPDLKFKYVSAGLNYTVGIDINNDVWTFGENGYGQLGLGDFTNRMIPTIIPFASLGLHNIKFQFVSAGSHHTLAIDLNNNVWGFGGNANGQLGLGHTRGMPIPTKIPHFKAKSVSCGHTHTVALDLNNNLWSFGDNDYGQLGLGDADNRETPTKIHFDDFGLPNLKFKSAVAARHYTVVLDFNDNVWVFGMNDHGQLGLGDVKKRRIPTKIPFGAFGMPELKVKSIFAGMAVTMIIDSNDDVYAFGSNSKGQLGVGDKINKLKPTKINNFKAKYIANGYLHTIALSDYDF